MLYFYREGKGSESAKYGYKNWEKQEEAMQWERRGEGRDWGYLS